MLSGAERADLSISSQNLQSRAAGFVDVNATIRSFNSHDNFHASNSSGFVNPVMHGALHTARHNVELRTRTWNLEPEPGTGTRNRNPEPEPGTRNPEPNMLSSPPLTAIEEASNARQISAGVRGRLGGGGTGRAGAARAGT